MPPLETPRCVVLFFFFFLPGREPAHGQGERAGHDGGAPAPGRGVGEGDHGGAGEPEPEEGAEPGHAADGRQGPRGDGETEGSPTDPPGLEARPRGRGFIGVQIGRDWQYPLKILEVWTRDARAVVMVKVAYKSESLYCRARKREFYAYIRLSIGGTNGGARCTHCRLSGQGGCSLILVFPLEQERFVFIPPLFEDQPGGRQAGSKRSARLDRTLATKHL